MAIKHGSKVDKSFSASSMTDLMFLLLLFLLIATTLINPNALKLMLPKSSNQLKDKAMTTVSIQDAGHGKYRYYVELQEVGSIEGVERALKTRLDGQKDATVSLHCDETVAVGETVKVMNIAKDNNYKLILATAVYALLLIGSFALVSFDFRQIHDKPGDTITIDFTEPPAPEPPKPRVRTATEPRVHDRTAPVEQTAQVSGKDETTQTPNPRALFNMNKGGADEPDNAGNPRAPEGEDKASGTGPGLNPDGLDQLDQGLQGRGLVGDLPKPSYPGSKSGKVIVRVTVDASGRVTSAAYEPKGSTTDAAELVEAAKAAARKARFTESRAAVQGGTITYVFRME